LIAHAGEAYLRQAYQLWQTLLASGSFEIMIEFLDKAIADFFDANEVSDRGASS
jgi:hypothetical protein